MGRRVVPVYCDRCLHLITEEQVDLQRLEKLAAVKSAWARMCPSEYEQTDAAKIPNQRCLNKVLGWQFGPRGLMIGGPTGQGKTRSLMLLCRRLVIEEGRQVKLFMGNSFARACADMFGEGSSTQWMKDAIKADVVVLDDLGKFKLTERVESELSGLVEERTSWGRPVLVTLNATGEELKAKLSADRGAPLLRRLREFCEPIAF